MRNEKNYYESQIIVFDPCVNINNNELEFDCDSDFDEDDYDNDLFMKLVKEA